MHPKCRGRHRSAFPTTISENGTKTIVIDSSDSSETTSIRNASRQQTQGSAKDEITVTPGDGHVTSKRLKRTYHSPSRDPRPQVVTNGKSAASGNGSVKGVTIGYWRDSEAPTVDLKHAVIGFIDVRERLRTRIQPTTLSGESISDEYPLPPGPGGSWVTFDKIVFLDHLVGLDQPQVKEYVKIRAEAIDTYELEGGRAAAEKAAVKEAVRRANLDSTTEDGTNVQPQVAYGVDLPEHLQENHDAKRRRTSGGFTPANHPPSNSSVVEHTPIQPAPGGPQPLRHTVDPLPGSRPTRILIGHWVKHKSSDPRDRNAVYGMLAQNDMFQLLVGETRPGQFVEGDFPAEPGWHWIAFEELAPEPHLENLTRDVIKEYCRVRQYQIDMGENEEERTLNETKAVYEAQARVAGTNYKAPAPLSVAPALSRLQANISKENDQIVKPGHDGSKPRRSRRVEAARAEARQSYVDIDTTSPQPAAAPRQSTGRISLNNNAIERTSALAEREIARVELAQERAHMQAANRERAAAAAAQAAQAAAANIPGLAVNGRQQLHERDEIQRLNKVWARQESLRLRTNAEDAKMYAGVKYERKTQGPFTGKLVSQGTIINIDGEDYIEYRVLAKPSFF